MSFDAYTATVKSGGRYDVHPLFPSASTQTHTDAYTTTAGVATYRDSFLFMRTHSMIWFFLLTSFSREFEVEVKFGGNHSEMRVND